MADIERYLRNITSQHSLMPNFMAWLAAYLEKADGAHGIVRELPEAFDVYKATGAQLDVIGQLVGVGREYPPLPFPDMNPLLVDNVYRRVILAKIVRNRWRGNYESFFEIWNETMRDSYQATYFDNQDMTMDVAITGDFSPVEIELVLGGHIIPKPMGVGMRVDLSTQVLADEQASFKTGAGSILAGVGGRTEIPVPRPTYTKAEINVNHGLSFFGNTARISIQHAL
jgi:hypothetical protein